MKKETGLWIDHRKAVIVFVSDEGEEIQEITSNLEGHVRFSGGTSEDGSPEDVRDRQFSNQLSSYYDEVIAVIRDSDLFRYLAQARPKASLKNAWRVKIWLGAS